MRRLGVPLAAALMLAACADTAGPDDDDPAAANPDWTGPTHGDGAAPNYAVVFPQDSLNTLRISMTAADWAAVRQNMVSLWGNDFGMPRAGGAFPSADPAYVPVTVELGGRRWLHAGFRLKGFSSLSGAWSQGNYKLPFRLNFDEFEDRFPEIHDQRFHGFEELSFSPGFHDSSLLHEKLAADIFRLAGVPAARTALYRVFMDLGQGPRYCGVYAAVEVIDDTMVDDQFGASEGNIYKPMSRLQNFTQGQFEKKNNKTAADWSDVQAFIAALNSPLRNGDRARWRAGLEATFDVDHFLRYLAVNNAISNWDTYGVTPHNFYLFNRVGHGLTWIPWDHNEALSGNAGVTGTATGPGAPGAFRPLSLTMNEVGPGWPLIRYLADDSSYFARYREHLRTFYDEVFTTARMNPLIEKYHALVAPHAVGPDGEQPGATFLPNPAAFTGSLAALRTHVQNRRAVIASFLQ